MTIPTERRNFWRAVFHAPVHLLSGERDVPAQLLDISLKGALLETNDDWKSSLGDEWILDLTLAPDTRITMKVSVIRVEEPQIGLKCEDIDLESIVHLRRLVEVNSGDPEILDKELGKLVHKA